MKPLSLSLLKLVVMSLVLEASPVAAQSPVQGGRWIVPVNDRFGFTLSAGSSFIYAGQELMQNTWRGVNAVTNGGTFPNTTVDRPYLSQYIARVSTTTNERHSFGVTLDYKLSPHDRLTFSYQWSSFSSKVHSYTAMCRCGLRDPPLLPILPIGSPACTTGSGSASKMSVRRPL